MLSAADLADNSDRINRKARGAWRAREINFMHGQGYHHKGSSSWSLCPERAAQGQLGHDSE